MVMTMHRLTAGAGYQYLLRHTASGDCDRSAHADLTGYYTASGNPPGRWLGAGLTGVGGELPVGSVVSEEAMANLFGAGIDPVTGAALGRAYPRFPSAPDRIAAQVARLPADLTEPGRTAAIASITEVELARPRPTPVAGFDHTFTPAKSVSALWALGDENTRLAVHRAHRAAVDQSIGFLEDRALFTRTGARGCRQVATRGLLAAAFDHWDSRAGDPNLHTHVVVANKVQEASSGRWLSVDSKALHHAVVAVSEVYDDLVADELARRLPVVWGWRHRGPRRSPGFELCGVDDGLLAEFSTRTTQIDEAMTAVVAQFYAEHGRGPNRIEVSRLRQQVTRQTRPDKHVRSLHDLIPVWRRRAIQRTGSTPEELTARVLRASQAKPVIAAELPGAIIATLAGHTIAAVLERRSTWTRWNVLAEAARSTRGIRMASPQDRLEILDRVTDAVLAECVSLETRDPLTVGPGHQREDGTSVFARPGEARYTHQSMLDAENRLLAAARDVSAPTIAEGRCAFVTARPVVRDGLRITLADDQAAAVLQIATSARRLDALLGPAGTGKTTTLAALKAAWISEHGRGTVLGLAPSSTAAAELAQALAVPCENTAKWLHETVGPGAAHRSELMTRLTDLRASAAAQRDHRRLRLLDTAIGAIGREQARWTMNPGQLVIVDEASLAGTLALDALLAQTTSAGAKLLLVGDHAQLSAVDAGGAFGLIVGRSPTPNLTSLWRFIHPWEGHATLALRTGDTRAIDAYLDHDRVQAGPAEAMCEAAYTAWQADTEAGAAAILLAGDGHTVAALNHRAHNDRVADGLVTGEGITTADGAVIGIGDRVITRANNRHLTTGDGYVRNGDLWQVTDLGDDGSMTVTPVHRTTRALIDEGRTVVLPAAYVAGHVELGYATTTHRAQGITVDAAHLLAVPGMVRENLYVGMTRGRAANHVYVAVDDVDPACDDLPDPQAAPDGRDVLARILATSGAELSATATIDARRNEASSLHRLDPIRQSLLADTAGQHWTTAIADTGMDQETVARIAASPDAGALFGALSKADAVSTDTPALLARLTAGLTDASDPARVLRARVDDWLHLQVEDPASIQPTCPAPPAGETTDLIAQVDQLIADRVAALAEHALDTRPAWLDGVGEMPDDAAGQAEWLAQVAAHAARADREQTTVITPRATPATAQVVEGIAR